ncbi:hypothetical protein D9611_007331 [Ephemerocybe angulata]|uniref:Uncharacterized protein n=1 Tax=Ephemerocybe angulata TaxID=980116 RepID=A0A8H5FLG5_9AGAR|nr:hypothetical protein D9611_007331 [Tulosesus angulatus]
MHIPFLSVALALTLAAFTTARSGHADLSLEARDYIDELTTRETLNDLSTRELMNELSDRLSQRSRVLKQCMFCKVRMYEPVRMLPYFKLMTAAVIDWLLGHALQRDPCYSGKSGEYWKKKGKDSNACVLITPQGAPDIYGPNSVFGN